MENQEKKTNSANSPTFGEINTIRNILMGQQISEYETKFDETNVKLIEQGNQLNSLIKNIQDQTENRFNSIEQAITERLDKLESLLMEKTGELNLKVEKLSSSDKADLGRMLSELGNRLINQDK